MSKNGIEISLVCPLKPYFAHYFCQKQWNERIKRSRHILFFERVPVPADLPPGSVLDLWMDPDLQDNYAYPKHCSEYNLKLSQ
jgi:hypothetical protein